MKQNRQENKNHCKTQNQIQSRANDCYLCKCQKEQLNGNCLLKGGNQLEITEYSVFPGIWLALKESVATAFEESGVHRRGLIEIAHCREGRLEYEKQDRYFYLDRGDMSIHKKDGKREVIRCPTGRYRGLAVIIDPKAAPRCTSCFLSGVDVELSRLFQKFISEDQPFILRATPRLEHIFSEIYEVPESLRNGYYKVKILELLLFLSYLEPDMSKLGRHSYSKTQAALMKQALEYIRENPNKRLTAQDLAKKFYVSIEQLRRSALSVYGKPLYQCIRIYKMHLAAACLLESDRTITDVAGEFGYDNSSKFAGAFRSVMGCAPADYRSGKSSQQASFHILE